MDGGVEDLSAFSVPVRCGRFTCRVNSEISPNTRLNWGGYMPRCVENLNNQG